MPANELALA